MKLSQFILELQRIQIDHPGGEDLPVYVEGAGLPWEVDTVEYNPEEERWWLPTRVSIK